MGGILDFIVFSVYLFGRDKKVWCFIWKLMGIYYICKRSFVKYALHILINLNYRL